MDFSPFAFWGVCLLAAAAHPLILASYARLANNRKESIATLYESAARNQPDDQAKPLGDILRDVYGKESNWRGHFLPVALCSVLSAVGAAVMMQHSDVKTPFTGTPVEKYLLAPNGTAILGFAGSYLASLYSLIDRFRSLTLSTFLLHLAWFRLTFGATFGATSEHFIAEGIQPAAAFAIGFLPIREVLEQLRDVARRAFGKDGKDAAQEERSWNLVQGATPDVIERLEEADVTSISALASQNPIAVMHKTNIPWRVLIDLMDQSIVITYVGDKITALRSIGIRGAIEAGIVYVRMRQGDPAADTTVTEMAKLLGCDRACVVNLIRNLSEDAQVRLLHQLWFETDGEEPRGRRGDGDRRVLFFVPEEGVSAEAIETTRQSLAQFGNVAPDRITLSPGVDLDAVSALLREAGFRFGPANPAGS